jgi:nitrous oxidase accessory protein NosD
MVASRAQLIANSISQVKDGKHPNVSNISYIMDNSPHWVHFCVKAKDNTEHIILNDYMELKQHLPPPPYKSYIQLHIYP